MGSRRLALAHPPDPVHGRGAERPVREQSHPSARRRAERVQESRRVRPDATRNRALKRRTHAGDKRCERRALRVPNDRPEHARPCTERRRIRVQPQLHGNGAEPDATMPRVGRPCAVRRGKKTVQATCGEGPARRTSEAARKDATTVARVGPTRWHARRASGAEAERRNGAREVQRAGAPETSPEVSRSRRKRLRTRVGTDDRGSGEEVVSGTRK